MRTEHCGKRLNEKIGCGFSMENFCTCECIGCQVARGVVEQERIKTEIPWIVVEMWACADCMIVFWEDVDSSRKDQCRECGHTKREIVFYDGQFWIRNSD